MDISDPVTEQLSLRETQRLISEAIAQLPPQRRRIFSMSRHQGMNIPEIAQALSLSPNSVKNTLVLALRDIRAHLERNGQLTPLMILFIFFPG
jgi:RNA polymerase sigma factor (sigma-70 family)